MMSRKAMDPSFTERQEDGDFTIEIVAYVTNSYVSVHFSSPEHEAHFSFDTFSDVSVAEARLHPALIAKSIEKAIGQGEVQYYFERRSDALKKELNEHSSRRRGGKR